MGGVDVSMLIGLPVSAFAYLWLCRREKTVEVTEERVAQP